MSAADEQLVEEFKDVRKGADWTERTAITQHNVALAIKKMQEEGQADARRIVDGLVQEHDQLLYARGYAASAEAASQYLEGRIAGLRLALAFFGVTLAVGS